MDKRGIMPETGNRELMETAGNYSEKMDTPLLLRILHCLDEENGSYKNIQVNVSEKHNGNFPQKYDRELSVLEIIQMLPDDRYNFLKLKR